MRVIIHSSPEAGAGIPIPLRQLISHEFSIVGKLLPVLPVATDGHEVYAVGQGDGQPPFAYVLLSEPSESDLDKAAAVVVNQVRSLHRPWQGTPLRIILRSGANPCEGAADAPLAWLPLARARFSAWCSALEQAVGPTDGLILWPHANGSISDVPSIQSFVRERQGRWQFIFDPRALIAPGMEARREDHFDRLFESLGSHSAAAACVVSISAAGQPALAAEGGTRWLAVALPRLMRQAASE